MCEHCVGAPLFSNSIHLQAFTWFVDIVDFFIVKTKPPPPPPPPKKRKRKKENTLLEYYSVWEACLMTIAFVLGFRSSTGWDFKGEWGWWIFHIKCFRRGLHHGHCWSYLYRRWRSHSIWGLKWRYCTEGDAWFLWYAFVFFDGLLVL